MIRKSVHSAVACILLLFAVAMWSLAAENPSVAPEYSTAPDGSAQVRLVTTPSGQLGFSGFHAPAAPLAMPDTSVLWVDRGHLNAISQDVFMSGDGMNIFVGWWLNNERISLYRTMAGPTPIWSRNYLCDWQISVGGSYDGLALAANGSGSEVGEWSKMSHIPNWTFAWPSGYSGASSEGVDISQDGSLVAAVA